MKLRNAFEEREEIKLIRKITKMETDTNNALERWKQMQSRNILVTQVKQMTSNEMFVRANNENPSKTSNAYQVIEHLK